MYGRMPVTLASRDSGIPGLILMWSEVAAYGYTVVVAYLAAGSVEEGTVGVVASPGVWTRAVRRPLTRGRWRLP